MTKTEGQRPKQQTTTGEGSPQAWHINNDQTLGKAVIMVEEEAVTLEKFALGRIEIYQGKDMISLDARQAVHLLAALSKMVADTRAADEKARAIVAKSCLATPTAEEFAEKNRRRAEQLAKLREQTAPEPHQPHAGSHPHQQAAQAAPQSGQAGSSSPLAEPVALPGGIVSRSPQHLGGSCAEAALVAESFKTGGAR